MKSYTSIEQAKKLAEFLPIESADMYWRSLNLNGHISWTSHSKRLEPSFYDFEHYTPCWSLAALLEAMPKYIRKYDGKVYRNYSLNLYRSYYYCCGYSFGSTTTDDDDNTLYCIGRDNWVDACVDMIIKLKENKVL